LSFVIKYTCIDLCSMTTRAYKKRSRLSDHYTSLYRYDYLLRDGRWKCLRRVFTRNHFLERHPSSKTIRKCILRMKETGSLQRDMRNYCSPVRRNVGLEKEVLRFEEILKLVCAVQLAHSVYRNIWCIAFYGEIIYGRFIINCACSNCWSEMKHRAFLWRYLLILFTR